MADGCEPPGALVAPSRSLRRGIAHLVVPETPGERYFQTPSHSGSAGQVSHRDRVASYVKSEGAARSWLSAGAAAGSIRVQDKARIFTVEDSGDRDLHPPELQSLLVYGSSETRSPARCASSTRYSADAEKDFWLKLDDLAQDANFSAPAPTPHPSRTRSVYWRARGVKDRASRSSAISAARVPVMPDARCRSP